MKNSQLLALGCILLAGGLLLATGCSDLTAKVAGTVMLDDKPLAVSGKQRGMVVFRPVAGGATCSGLISDTGKYSVSTGSAAALAPGDYLVSVRVMELVPPEGDDEAPSGKPITPAVYGDPLTSGLSLTVEGGPNQYDIQLKSSAGPAVIPPVTPPEDHEQVEGEGDGEAAEEAPADEAAPEEEEREDAADGSTEPAAPPQEADKPAAIAAPEGDGDES